MQVQNLRITKVCNVDPVSFLPLTSQSSNIASFRFWFMIPDYSIHLQISAFLFVCVYIYIYKYTYIYILCTYTMANI